MKQSGSGSARIIAVVLCSAAVLGAVLHFNLLASNVIATWSYNYSRIPSCSPSMISDCIDHFEILDITHPDRLRTILSVNNVASPSGKVDGITARFKYGPPFGQVTFSVVAIKREKDGGFVSSNPFAARATASIRPIASASLSF